MWDSFNNDVNHLPTTLKQLSLGDSCEKPVNNLSPALTELFLGCSFNCTVNSLPPGLLVLQLNGAFNQSLNCLPLSLTKLSFTQYPIFNQPLDSLPHPLLNYFLLMQLYLTSQLTTFHMASLNCFWVSIYCAIATPPKFTYIFELGHEL